MNQNLLTTQQKKKTLGERRIRPDFAKNEEVRELKALYTLLYDKIFAIQGRFYNTMPHSDEVLDGMDATAKAMNNLETSCMYAVKALTI